MGLFDKVKKTTIESRRYEEKLYEVALEEVEAGEVKKGLYAKAVAKANGDKEKVDGMYLKLRVQSIMDDIESEQIDRRINERAYKALQEIRKTEVIQSSALSIRDESIRILGEKGLKLDKEFGGEWVISDKKTGLTEFRSRSFITIRGWIVENVK